VLEKTAEVKIIVKPLSSGRYTWYATIVDIDNSEYNYKSIKTFINAQYARRNAEIRLLSLLGDRRLESVESDDCQWLT